MEEFSRSPSALCPVPCMFQDWPLNLAGLNLEHISDLSRTACSGLVFVIKSIAFTAEH